jgi:hypothetical protein
VKKRHAEHRSGIHFLLAFIYYNHGKCSVTVEVLVDRASQYDGDYIPHVLSDRTNVISRINDAAKKLFLQVFKFHTLYENLTSFVVILREQSELTIIHSTIIVGVILFLNQNTNAEACVVLLDCC